MSSCTALQEFGKMGWGDPPEAADVVKGGQSQPGQSLEQPGLVEGWNQMGFKVLPTQTMLAFQPLVIPTLK